MTKADDHEVETLMAYLHSIGEKVRKVKIENIGGTRIAKVERMDGTTTYFQGVVRNLGGRELRPAS